MRKLRGLAAAALVCGSLFCGCGSDGGTDIAAIQQALEECSESAMTGMIRTLIAIVSVPDVIAGEDPPPGLDVNVSLSVDPMDPPNTWDFSIVFDSNGNLIADSAIVGSITFSEDPTDGFNPGATLDINFTVQNSPVIAGDVENGTVTGTGDLLVTIGATEEQATISGTISLTDTAGDGCVADLTFPVATPINLEFTDLKPGPIGQLAATVGFFEIFGTIQAVLESLGHTLTADLTLTEDDQTVNVMGDIDGTDVDFDFELLPSEEVISQLSSCAFGSIFLVEFFLETYDSVLDAVRGGTVAGVIVTPTGNPNVFDYSIDLTAFPGVLTFSAGMVTGQATLTFPPPMPLSVLAPSEVAFTWTMTGAVITDGPTLSGQNITGRPLRIALDEFGEPASFSGAGTLTLDGPTPPLTQTGPTDCDISFDIPESDPLLGDETDGTVILTATIGEDEMVIIFDVGAGEPFVTINGIPFSLFF